MKKVIIIPARYSSTRLPGKPLLDIHGKPMIIRVCESVKDTGFEQVVVATDDKRIFETVEQSGFTAVMTKSTHVSGTDRLQEAAEKMGLSDEDIIVNLQGDEPLMPSKNLTQVAGLLESNTQASVATLFENELASKAAGNPNAVKVVFNKNDEALYFSRASIPFDRDEVRDEGAIIHRHVGIYAYRKKALDQFIQYGESELEKLEKLEQLRFMDNGDVIAIQKAEVSIPPGVDTVEDLENVRQLFERV
jgi:3-deoxy-manno-octulosonate cytidylyltransferase (CMP-KDO synthetase)